MHIPSGEKVAIKVMEKNRIINEKDIERVSREVKILKRLQHPNTIKLYDTISSANHIYLVMEYADGGDLFDFILQNERVNEQEAVCVFKQLIEAVDYIHSIGVAHRDIKPENILFERKNLNIKLVDYGLSNTYQKGMLLNTACGSPCYASPEMINKKEYDGLMSDVWSCGVVLFCMLTGRLPFDTDDDIPLLYDKISNLDFSIPSFVSPLAKDLLRKIFVLEPEKRIPVKKIRKHLWLTGVKIKYNTPFHDQIPEDIVEYTISQVVEKMNDKITADNLRKQVANNQHNYSTALCFFN